MSAAGAWAWLAVLVSIALAACGDGDPPVAAASPATPLPSPAPSLPAATPHDGHWLPLGGEHVLEFRHDANWGTVEVWLYDRDLEPRELDGPPVLHALLEEEAVRVEPTRDIASLDGLEDLDEGARSWTFEHDALLGEPDRARFRLRVGGKVYTPLFFHPHGGHGHGPGHGHAAAEDEGEPHDPSLLHGAGPHGGILYHLGGHLWHVEVKHDANMGTVLLWLYDEALRLRSFDRRPVLGAVLDEETVTVEGAREDDEGNELDGWYFEETALLGIPERARFRLVVDGIVYTPDLVYVPHGEEPGHSHDAPAEDDVLAAAAD